MTFTNCFACSEHCRDGDCHLTGRHRVVLVRIAVYFHTLYTWQQSRPKTPTPFAKLVQVPLMKKRPAEQFTRNKALFPKL